MSLEPFFLRDGSDCLASVAFEWVLFTKTSLRAPCPWVRRFYEAFVESFGTSVTLCQREDEPRMEQLTPATRRELFAWTDRGLAEDQPTVGVDLHSGRVSRDAMPPAFELFHDENDGRPYSFFRVVFPRDFLDAGTSAFLRYVDRALEGFPITSGWAGYSFFWRTLDPAVHGRAAAWSAPFLRRHPGLSTGDVQELAETARDGLIGVSWMTFLGPQVVRRLRGQASLERSLASTSGVSVFPVKDALVVQAGDRPRVGDVGREGLPEYRAVGAKLRRARAPGLDEVWVEGLEPDEMEDWLCRFLR